jgi:iron(III) transport system ATP-binding protein
MLILEDIVMRFGKTVVLDRVSIEVGPGEVVCLLGPSGSGKSTLLRAVAGIERVTSGRIVLDGIEVSGPRGFVEPEQRRVGMVFQDYALFPHLTVAANVAFGVHRDRGAIANLLQRLGLERLKDSYPHMLSGGESQRVALARAMAPQPRVLLMDEPFSSLDSRLRDDVRRHTLEFVRESKTTTIIVTHDPDEAMRIGDRIALLDAGRLIQFGTPEELYSRPSTLFAARFFSDVAAVSGSYANGRVETALGSFAAPEFNAGNQATACIRPQHLRVAPGPAGVPARVVSSEFSGAHLQLLVMLDGLETPVALSVPRHIANAHGGIRPGATIQLEINPDDVPVVPVPKSTKELLHAQ